MGPTSALSVGGGFARLCAVWAAEMIQIALEGLIPAISATKTLYAQMLPRVVAIGATTTPAASTMGRDLVEVLTENAVSATPPRLPAALINPLTIPVESLATRSGTVRVGILFVRFAKTMCAANSPATTAV